jgi:subtilase family serine protease
MIRREARAVLRSRIALLPVLVAVLLVAGLLLRAGASRSLVDPTGSGAAAGTPASAGGVASGSGSSPGSGTGSGSGAAASGPGSGPDVTLGATDPSVALQVDFVLRQPGKASIDAFLAALNDPSSVDYRRYLSPAQFGARFGLDDAAIGQLRTALEAAGLRVSNVEPQRTLLHALGTVGAAERLLGIGMQDRQTANGTRFHAPTGEPQIPALLRESVTGVTGLSDRPDVHPLFRPPLVGDVRAGGMLPEDLRRAYDLEGLADAGMDGTGQTIAIVSFDSFLDSDVAAWEALTGVHGPPVEHVPFAGPVQVGDGTDEVNLDIDTIRSVAPQAKLLDFELNRRGGTFAAMINAILNDGRADIISISWGHCESQSSAASRAASDAEFQAANAAGISIYVASGDEGAFDCNGAQVEGDLTVSVDYPSASPYVISVGGTTLSVRQDGTYYGETAWANPLRGTGTGGGESEFYARPAWQQAAGIDPGKLNRLVPDVAGPADSGTGILFLFTPGGTGEPGQAEGGGTSQAAPFWAGTTALIRQFADAQGALPTVNGQKRIGDLAQPLYELAASSPNGPVFHDITLGSNLKDPAGAGWDPATGLGSPIGTALAQALVARFQSGTP